MGWVVTQQSHLKGVFKFKLYQVHNTQLFKQSSVLELQLEKGEVVNCSVLNSPINTYKGDNAINLLSAKIFNICIGKLNRYLIFISIPYKTKR